MIALLLLTPLPDLPIPLRIHGWEEVASQPALNDPSVTMKFWVAPDSIRPVEGQTNVRTAAISIETILANGEQHHLQSIGHVFDCGKGTWQVDWAAFEFQGKAFVSYFARDQRDEPTVPEAGTAMAAVVDRVCSKKWEPAE